MSTAEDLATRRPEYVFDQAFLYDPQPLFWPVMHELFENKPKEQYREGFFSRVAARGMTRTNRRRSFSRLMEDLGDGAPENPMPTTVSMIAGQVWKKVHRMPDRCAATLYRNGEDFTGWHVDYQALLGPAPDDAWVCVVTLGASRTLDFAPLPWVPGTEPEVCESLRLTTGSLLWMRGETMRYFMHQLRPAEGESGPRIALAFTFDPPEDHSKCPYLLLDGMPEHANDRVPRPVYCGEAEEVIGMWNQLAEMDLPEGTRLWVQLPDGTRCTSLGRATSKLLDRTPSPAHANRLLRQLDDALDDLTPNQVERLGRLATDARQLHPDTDADTLPPEDSE